MNSADREREIKQRIESSGSFRLRRLPKNCQATHIVQKMDSDDKVIPLKFVFEGQSGIFHFNQSRYNGLFAIVFKNFKILILHREETDTNHAKTNGLLQKHSDKLERYDNCYTWLQSNYDDFSKDMNVVLNDVKSDVAECKGRNQKAVSFSLRELQIGQFYQSIVPNFEMTPAGCLADAFFHLDAQQRGLGIQIKSSSQRKSGGYVFSKINQYDNLLVICRPLSDILHLSLCIPGDHLTSTSSIGINFESASKYIDFAVDDGDLAKFLEKLTTAIISGRKKCRWPSGMAFDITNISPATFDVLRIPISPTQQKEQAMNDWRLLKLPELEFRHVLEHDGVVDIIINNIKVQDKIAYKCAHSLRVDVAKRNGKTSVKRPYDVGDFDALWIFESTKRHVWFIPAEELEKRFFFRDYQCLGKKCLIIHDLDYVGLSNNTWTKKFCHLVNDETERLQLIAAVKTYSKQVLIES